MSTSIPVFNVDIDFTDVQTETDEHVAKTRNRSHNAQDGEQSSSNESCSDDDVPSGRRFDSKKGLKKKKKKIKDKDKDKDKQKKRKHRHGRNDKKPKKKKKRRHILERDDVDSETQHRTASEEELVTFFSDKTPQEVIAHKQKHKDVAAIVKAQDRMNFKERYYFLPESKAEEALEWIPRSSRHLGSDMVAFSKYKCANLKEEYIDSNEVKELLRTTDFLPLTPIRHLEQAPILQDKHLNQVSTVLNEKKQELCDIDKQLRLDTNSGNPKIWMRRIYLMLELQIYELKHIDDDNEKSKKTDEKSRSTKKALKRKQKCYVGFLQRLKTFYDKAIKSCEHRIKAYASRIELNPYCETSDDDSILDMLIGRLSVLTELYANEFSNANGVDIETEYHSTLSSMREVAQKNAGRELVLEWIQCIITFAYHPKIISRFLEIYLQGNMCQYLSEDNVETTTLDDIRKIVFKLVLGRTVLQQQNISSWVPDTNIGLVQVKESSWLLHVFDQYCFLLEHAGYTELAFGMYQAMFEYNCARPFNDTLHSVNVTNEYDENAKCNFFLYWESDAARIGDETTDGVGDCGWTNWYRSNDSGSVERAPCHSLHTSKALMAMEKKRKRSALNKKTTGEPMYERPKDIAHDDFINPVISKIMPSKPMGMEDSEVNQITEGTSTKTTVPSTAKARPSAADFFTDFSFYSPEEGNTSDVVENEWHNLGDLCLCRGEIYSPRTSLSKTDDPGVIDSNYIYSVEHGKRIKVDLENDQLNNSDVYKSILASVTTNRILNERKKKWQTSSKKIGHWFNDRSTKSDAHKISDKLSQRSKTLLALQEWAKREFAAESLHSCERRKLLHLSVNQNEALSQPERVLIKQDLQYILFPVHREDPNRIEIARRLLSIAGIEFLFAHFSGHSYERLRCRNKTGFTEGDIHDFLFHACTEKGFISESFKDIAFRAVRIHVPRDSYIGCSRLLTCIRRIVDTFPDNVEFMSILLQVEAHASKKESMLSVMERIRCLARYFLEYLEHNNNERKYMLWLTFAELESIYGTIRKSRMIFDNVLRSAILHGSKSISEITFKFFRLEILILEKRGIQRLSTKTINKIVRTLACASGLRYIQEVYSTCTNRDYFHKNTEELSSALVAMIRSAFQEKCKSELGYAFKQGISDNEYTNNFAYTVACLAWLEYFLLGTKRATQVLENARNALLTFREEIKARNTRSYKYGDVDNVCTAVDLSLRLLFCVQVEMFTHEALSNFQNPSDNIGIRTLVRKALDIFPCYSLFIALQTHIEIRKFCISSYFDRTRQEMLQNDCFVDIQSTLFRQHYSGSSFITFWMFAILKQMYQHGFIPDVSIRINKAVPNEYLKSHRQVIHKIRNILVAAKGTSKINVLYWRLCANFESQVSKPEKTSLGASRSTLNEGIRYNPFSKLLRLDEIQTAVNTDQIVIIKEDMKSTQIFQRYES